MARRKVYLYVCNNRRPDGHPKGSCAERGSESVHATLKAEIAKAGLAPQVARACTASCLDVCSQGVVIGVSPIEGPAYFYGKVTLEDVPEIVAALRDGGRVERLVVGDDRFD